MSDKLEFVLQPNSVFNVSCTGNRNVVWTEPLLENTFVFPGYYTATLFIYNATVENTGYYMCTYENREGEVDGELEEENEIGIYVFVPGKQAVLSPSPLFGTVVLPYIEIQRIWEEKNKGDGSLSVIYT